MVRIELNMQQVEVLAQCIDVALRQNGIKALDAGIVEILNAIRVGIAESNTPEKAKTVEAAVN